MSKNEISQTQYFSNVEKEEKNEVLEILDFVYHALADKGYNPVNQIVGYILSGDPTYITSHENARSVISRIERDELLEEVVTFYLKNKLN